MSSSRNLPLAVVTLLAALALAAPVASARDGDLDPSFGTGGRVVATGAWPGFEHPRGMDIDQQGRIVVVDEVPRMITSTLVRRFNPDGSTDQSFGSGGFVIPEQHGDSFSAVEIDAAGRVLLTGGPADPALGQGLVVVRLLENGQPDPSFDEDGEARFEEAGSVGHGFDLAFDGQGRLLVAGQAKIEERMRMVTLRLTASGDLDPSFDEDGIAVADFGGSEFADTSAAQALTVDASGRILVAGAASLKGNQRLGIAGFDPQGRPDPTLAGDGTTTIDFGPWPHEEGATDIALDSRNRIVLSGVDSGNFTLAALAVRLLPGGSPDPSFDGDGRTALSLPSTGFGRAVAIDGAGRIVLAGDLARGETTNAFIARLKEGGSLDGSFGTGGLVREDFGLGYGTGADLAVDSAGRYLITGTAVGRGKAGFGLARYLNDTPEPVGRCRGKRATIAGTAGPDRLRGTRGRDVIVAFGGNDRIRALAGRDLICAGRGRDLVRAGAGNDRVFGGRGNDRLLGQAGSDRLFGGRGKDNLFGGAGRDVER